MNIFLQRAMVIASVASTFCQATEADTTVRIKKRGSVAAHKAKLRSLAFSPDGRLLVSASDDRTVRIWNLSDGTLKSTSKPIPGQTSVAFSPDGKLLFIARGRGPSTVDFFDVASRDTVRSLNTRHRVENVTVSPDGRRVATAAFLDEYLKVWDVATGAPVKTLTSPTRAGRGADESNLRPMGYTAFSPDGKFFAGCAASPNYVAIPTIWDAKTLEIYSRFVAHDRRCHSIMFSPDSKTLAIGTEDGTLKLWSVVAVVKAWATRTDTKATAAEIDLLIKQLDDDNFQVRETAERELRKISAAAEGPLRKTRESTKSAEVRARIDTILKSISRAGTKPLETLKPGAVLTDEQTGGVRSLAFSPNGRLLAAGFWKHTTIEGQLTVFELSQPDKPVFNLETFGIEAVAFSPDGRTLASGMHDGTITLWDVTSAK